MFCKLWDRKFEYYDLATEEGLDFLWFLFSDFHDNWLRPPNNVPLRLWANLLGELLAVEMELRASGQMLLTDAIYELLSEREDCTISCPTLFDLCERLRFRGKHTRGSARETYLGMAYKLHMMAETLGTAASSSITIDWKTLSELNWAICVTGLPSSYQAMQIKVCLAKELLYRQFNNIVSSILKQLFVIEEAEHLFPRTSTRKNSILLDEIRQSRGCGCGVIFVTQSTAIDSTIPQNCALKIAVGGFGEATAISSFASSVGLDPAQVKEFHTMRSPGNAIISDIRTPWPFSAQLFKPNKSPVNLSPDEIKAISKRSERTLLEKCGFHADGSNSTFRKSHSGIQHMSMSAGHRVVKPRKVSSHLQKKVSKKAVLNGRRIMKAILEHPTKSLFRDEAARQAGITGGATLANAERALVELGEITRHTFSIKKTEKSAWEILDKGFDSLGVERPVERAGKGGFLHKFGIERLYFQHAEQGHQCKIEYRRPSNSKQVDLRVQMEATIRYYEVCASEPVVDKELSNLRLDTEGEPLPDEIIFAVTNRKMRKPLEIAIANYIAETGFAIPLTVELLGDLIIPIRSII